MHSLIRVKLVKCGVGRDTKRLYTYVLQYVDLFSLLTWETFPFFSINIISWRKSSPWCNMKLHFRVYVYGVLIWYLTANSTPGEGKHYYWWTFRPDEDQGNPGRNVVSDKKCAGAEGEELVSLLLMLFTKNRCWPFFWNQPIKVSGRQFDHSRQRGQIKWNYFSIFRACAFFLVVSRHFFHQTYAGAWKKTKYPKKKKRTGLVFQTTWPTFDTPRSLCWALSFAKNIFCVFPNDGILVVKQLPVAPVRKLNFPLYLTFLRCQRMFSTQPINIANAFVFPRSFARWEALTCSRCFRFLIKHTSWFCQSKTSLLSANSMFGDFNRRHSGFWSPRPDSLAKDCHLIMARRRWNLLNFLSNVYERKASCVLNNEWCETLILSSSSIRQRERRNFLPPRKNHKRNCNIAP